MKNSLTTNLVVFGLIGIGLAAVLALGIGLVNQRLASRPEAVVLAIGGIFGVIALLPISIHFLRRGRLDDPGKIGLTLVSMLPILLSAIYLYQVSFQIKFPGDFLIWSESDFVNDILKFRVGYPIYSDQQNNDSFVYPVGPQLSTYFLASLVGKPLSIPTYRTIQLLYTFLAALVSLFCCIQLLQLILPGSLQDQKIFGLILLPLLFLLATNPLTNPFVHNLHDDALALLVSAAAFFLLLLYIRKRVTWVVVGMSIMPGVGLLVKQSLVIWLFFYLGYLVFFDQPRSWRRVALVSTLSLIGIGIVLGVSYALWGTNYFYWVYTVLGSHGVSPLRSFRNLLTVWPAFSLGLLGGLILLRGSNLRRLIAPWLIWLGFTGLEIYTSGIAWMVNHVGPGTLLAGVWFGVGLIHLRQTSTEAQSDITPLENWLSSGISIVLSVFLLSALGIIRIPLKPDMEDLYRYLGDIEDQFAGMPAENVLLDAGSWVYLKEGVVMKDRSPSIGERGYSQTGDFSALIERLEIRKYSKILVRNYHAADFWYDHYLWPASSGIRQKMEENYREIGLIKGVKGMNSYLFADISILVPR